MEFKVIDTSDRPTCKTCVYWWANAALPGWGECRPEYAMRSQKELEERGHEWMGSWYATRETDGCGTHHDFKEWLEAKKEMR